MEWSVIEGELVVIYKNDHVNSFYSEGFILAEQSEMEKGPHIISSNTKGKVI